jgi:hypothetical protein
MILKAQNDCPFNNKPFEGDHSLIKKVHVCGGFKVRLKYFECDFLQWGFCWG